MLSYATIFVFALVCSSARAASYTYTVVTTVDEASTNTTKLLGNWELQFEDFCGVGMSVTYNCIADTPCPPSTSDAQLVSCAPGFIGTDSEQCATGECSFRWSFYLASAGEYNVNVSWPSLSDSYKGNDMVYYTMSDVNTTTVIANQTANSTTQIDLATRYYELGQFLFTSGMNSITAYANNSNGILYADSVQISIKSLVTTTAGPLPSISTSGAASKSLGALFVVIMFFLFGYIP